MQGMGGGKGTKNMGGMGGMGKMGGGMGGGLGMIGMSAAGGLGGGGKQGEVRYDSPQSAATAIQGLNGSSLMGEQIQVVADPNSHDGTKVICSGLAPGVG